MSNFIILAVFALVLALFWGISSSSIKSVMFSLCLSILLGLKFSLGWSNNLEKVGDYSCEENGNKLGREEAVDEEEVPPEELKFICTPEPICIDYTHFNEMESSPRIKRNSDKKKLRDNSYVGSEVMVLTVPSNDHVVIEHNELEAFNKRVDDFIAEFNRQIRLERQQTSTANKSREFK